MSKFYEKSYVKWRYDKDQELRKEGFKEGMGIQAPLVIAAASIGLLGLTAWNGVRKVFKQASNESSILPHNQKNNS